MQRPSKALAAITTLEEKTMFSGLRCRVNGNMCICVNKNEMMYRIGPADFETAEEMNGCRPLLHNGKTIKCFVFVSEEAINAKATCKY